MAPHDLGDLGQENESLRFQELTGTTRYLERNVHCVLGVPLDMVTMSDVLDSISDAASTRQRLFISTLNLNFIALSQRNMEFRKSLIASNLCLTDGVAVKLVANLLGAPITERVAGSDILNAIWEAPEVTRNGPLKVFLFGGTDEASDKAARAINSRNPDCIICVGNICPGFGSVEDMSTNNIIDTINSAKPDFLIVALGAQKGQAWIMHNMVQLDVPVISHLGATINFIAGTLKRAPPGWQKLGLEWLWRIRQEPGLAKRYWKDGITLLRLLLFKIAPISIWRIWSKWRWRTAGFSVHAKAPHTGSTILALEGNFTSVHLVEFEHIVANNLGKRQSLCLDLSGMNWIDSRAMGSLLLLPGRVKNNGGTLKIEGASTSLERVFRANGLNDLWNI